MLCGTHFSGQEIEIDQYVSQEITVVDQSTLIDSQWETPSEDVTTTSSITTGPIAKRSVAKSENISMIKMAASDDVKLFTCKYCDFKALTSSEAAEHKYTTHTTELPHACPVEGCIYRTKYGWSVKHHVKSFHSDEKDYKCSICDYAAKTKLEVRRHIQSDHEGRKRTCSDCDFQCPFKSRSTMVKHMESVHGILDNSIHKCDYCDYTTTQSLQNLADHINAKHAKAIKYCCSICSFSTYSKYSLKLHEYAHQNAKGNTPYRYTSRSVNPKKSVPRFWCSICGDSFTSEDLTLLHIKDRHDITDNATPVPTLATKPGTLYFKCSICESKFTSKLLAEEHVATEHDGGVLEAQFEEDEDYSASVIQCKHCPFKTSTLCGLRSHVRAKHELRLLKCDICNFGTMHRSALTTHMVRQHGATPSPQTLSKSAKKSMAKKYREELKNSSQTEEQPSDDQTANHQNAMDTEQLEVVPELADQ